jgi:signal peptide peptidase-like protein 2B
VSYALTRNYLLSNLIAYFVVITVFRGMRLNSLKVATLLLILAFIYDIWWVFFSPLLFGRSVMAVVATQVDLPMKF